MNTEFFPGTLCALGALSVRNPDYTSADSRYFARQDADDRAQMEAFITLRDACMDAFRKNPAASLQTAAYERTRSMTLGELVNDEMAGTHGDAHMGAILQIIQAGLRGESVQAKCEEFIAAFAEHYAAYHCADEALGRF